MGTLATKGESAAQRRATLEETMNQLRKELS